MFITGASRGIGKAIALRAAQDGANVAVVAKTAEPHPKLPGTVYSAMRGNRSAGGKALPCVCDIRFEDQVLEAVAKTVSHVSAAIDILVNNASAISLTRTPDTDMKRYDLMHGINTRGTFLCSKACHPAAAERRRIPTSSRSRRRSTCEARWFAPHVAYTIAKFGMSLCVLGMAEEFREAGIAVNALWPKTVIATAAVQNLLGGDTTIARSRKPEIMSDAAHHILTRPSREFTGQFCVDEDVLHAAGVRDLDQYACTPGAELTAGFFRLIASERRRDDPAASTRLRSQPPITAFIAWPAASIALLKARALRRSLICFQRSAICSAVTPLLGST